MPSYKKHYINNTSSKQDTNKNKQQPEQQQKQDQQTIKPLIAIPSVRDLQEFKQTIKQIKNIDKLWIKYTPTQTAYPLIQSEFLSNPNNYTHLIILPDDLIVEPDKLQYLIDDYKTSLTPEERYTTILTGFCNVDEKSNNDKANVCTDEVIINRHGRTYPWLKLEHLRTLKHNIDISENTQTRDYLIPVKFAGFPLFIIPRNIVEQVSFRDDSNAEFRQTGVCWDVMYCHDSQQKGFHIYTDIRVDLKHLRLSNESEIQLNLQRQRERQGYQKVINHPMIQRQIHEAQERGEIDYLFRPHIKYDYTDHSHVSLLDTPEIKK